MIQVQPRHCSCTADANCPTGYTCGTTGAFRGRCIEGAGSPQACTDDTQCTGGGSGRCATPVSCTCTGNSQCPSGYVCATAGQFSGRCVDATGATQGCTANSECPENGICDTPGASGFCREPEGLGKSCTGAADCGGEATYCETFVTMTCIVEKCASNPSMCPSGQVCCDATGFLGTSLCTPTSALMGGLCFDGNAPVSP